jgi:hypothetical protein
MGGRADVPSGIPGVRDRIGESLSRTPRQRLTRRPSPVGILVLRQPHESLGDRRTRIDAIRAPPLRRSQADPASQEMSSPASTQGLPPARERLGVEGAHVGRRALRGVGLRRLRRSRIDHVRGRSVRASESSFVSRNGHGAPSAVVGRGSSVLASRRRRHGDAGSLEPDPREDQDDETEDCEREGLAASSHVDISRIEALRMKGRRAVSGHRRTRRRAGRPRLGAGGRRQRRSSTISSDSPLAGSSTVRRT